MYWDSVPGTFFWYCLYWDNVPTWYRMYRNSLTGIACFGTVYRTWYRRGSPTSPDDSCSLTLRMYWDSVPGIAEGPRPARMTAAA